MKRYVMAAALVLAVGACDKGSQNNDKAHASAQLSPDEAAMLASLPGGNVLLFGGNYLRFQKYLNESPLNRLMGTYTQANGGTGMTEWMSCFGEMKDLAMLGVARLDASTLQVRYVMTGTALSQIEACAKRAGFPATMDADQKFLALELPGLQGPMKSGYLVVAGGMLYTGVSMQFPMTTVPTVERAQLEQDVASIAKQGSAATDKALIAQIANVDRSKAIWFVANGAGTPVADKLGNAYGTFDIGDGLSIDVTAQVVDSTLEDQIYENLKTAKQRASHVGGPLGTLLDKLVIKRIGDRLHVQLALDNAQLGALVDQVAPFMPRAAAAP